MYSKRHTDRLFEMDFKMEYSLEDRNKLMFDKKYQIIFLTPSVSKEFEQKIINLIKKTLENQLNHDLHVAISDEKDMRVEKYRVYRKEEKEIRKEFEMIKEHNIVAQL